MKTKLMIYMAVEPQS